MTDGCFCTYRSCQAINKPCQGTCLGQDEYINSEGTCEKCYHSIKTRKSWGCQGKCQSLAAPCHGKCPDNWKLNCKGYCEKADVETFYMCNNSCQKIDLPCNQRCYKNNYYLNCQGVCIDGLKDVNNQRTWMCKGQCQV